MTGSKRFEAAGRSQHEREAEASSSARYFTTGVGAAGAAAAVFAYRHLRAALRSDSDESLGTSLTGTRGDHLAPPLLELRPGREHITVDVDREVLGDAHQNEADGPGAAIADVMARLGSAVDDDRWSLAEAAVERTVELALGAIVAGDQPALRQLGSEVRKLRFRMALDHDMSEVPTAERIVGMLGSMAALIGLAELARPPAEARNVAEAILQTLLHKHQLTTSELAKESGYRQETVARTLVHMRKAGIILSVKAGRHMQNSLTASGRRRALGLIRDSQVGDTVGHVEPMTLRRHDDLECSPVVRPADLLAIL